MIDFPDLLFLAGAVLLLVVAFHFGLWIGLALLAIYCMSAGRQWAKVKSLQRPRRRG